ncbi:MAG: TonB-dependent receptor domain-containing protein [Vulcanimicrobiaceae bacterium]
MPRLWLRRALVAVILAVALLGQGTWALAGTTGGMTGLVTDATSGAPIANAKVTASSPSETISTKSDSSGHFVFLSLPPDTYDVAADKEGYAPFSQPGVTVFADAQATLSLKLQPALKTIANVTSRAAGNLVRPGTTADVYSVNAATQGKINALGGGGSLNSAYSAVASVPGAVMPLNQAGYFQTVHIRGGDYDQVGYEFDGVPVNRSFDNYPSGALSSLGMSELQVYTGATPAGSEGQGLAGYVNQVIKTGTHPGFGEGALGIGTSTFYHKAAAEVGGASPNRLFSYYAGIGGYNQDFRVVTNDNAVQYSNQLTGLGTALVQLTPTTLNPDGSCTGAATDINFAYCYANGFAGPGGYLLAPYQFGTPATITARDVVVNLHFGLPHKNDGGRDDVQLLWDSSLLLNGFYESVNDSGGPGSYPANSNNPGPPIYLDGFQYTGPVGGLLPSNYASFVGPYYYPNSPTQRPAFSTDGVGTPLGLNQRDTTWNNQGIVKLQYQKNIGSNAYVRIYGYTYYSNWLQNGPLCSFENYGCAVSSDYELSSHTRGLSLTFADQLNSQNLLNVEANYTTAISTRDNNTQIFNPFSSGNPANSSRSVGAVLVNANDPTAGVCYTAPTLGATATPSTCGSRTGMTYLNWGCLESFSNPFCNDTVNTPATISAFTCGTGPCGYLVAENSLFATYNQVVPKFYAFSVQDQWRLSNKWLLNIGIRNDRFEFDGANTNPNDPARQFWFKAFNLDNCVQANGFTLVAATSPGVCPAGTTPARLTNESGQVFSYSVFQPRFSGTYTASPDTVFRFSAGKYVEPPNTAYEQYNTLQENLASYIGGNFYKFGFTTPGHEVRPPTSDNYDISWEQHLKGTDWSLKLTPFYRHTQNQIQNFFLDQSTGFISGLNVGSQTSDGIEFQVNKGDFNANGFSALFSFTYTNSYINYGAFSNGSTVVSQINNDIQTYNGYTSFCATHPSDSRCGTTSSGAPASPCYDSTGAGVSCATAGAIANPYWNAPVQTLLNTGAAYPVYDIFPGGIGGSANSFSIPYAAALVLNYKHNKWAVTPTFQFLGGNRYGSPETSPGVDPAAGGCTALAGSTANDPRYPYGTAGGAPYNALGCTSTIVIPNPYTKVYDQPGAFVNPNEFLMNMQISYEISPKITLVGTLANIVNTCWGGTKTAWTFNDGNICSYSITNSLGAIPPVGNVYNPGAVLQPFIKFPYGAYLGPVNVDSNSNLSSSTKAPFNFYLEAHIKM